MSEKLNKRWQKLCEDIAAEARRLGAKEPFIYACESGLCVTDGLANPSKGSKPEVLFILNKPPLSVIDYDSGGS